jgi:hypothetical protein
MFATLKKYEVEATFWNQTVAGRQTGGLTQRSAEQSVTLRTVFMHAGREFIDEPEGRFKRDLYTFQVGKDELYRNSFTIVEGRTFITYKGENYRVVRLHDYRDYYQMQLIECLCVKIVDVD